jgi:hypothetical protein
MHRLQQVLHSLVERIDTPSPIVLVLVVDDLSAARDDLLSRGTCAKPFRTPSAWRVAPMSAGPAPGPDPKGGVRHPRVLPRHRRQPLWAAARSPAVCPAVWVRTDMDTAALEALLHGPTPRRLRAGRSTVRLVERVRRVGSEAPEPIQQLKP